MTFTFSNILTVVGGVISISLFIIAITGMCIDWYKVHIKGDKPKKYSIPRRLQ